MAIPLPFSKLCELRRALSVSESACDDDSGAFFEALQAPSHALSVSESTCDGGSAALFESLQAPSRALSGTLSARDGHSADFFEALQAPSRVLSVLESARWSVQSFEKGSGIAIARALRNGERARDGVAERAKRARVIWLAL